MLIHIKNTDLHKQGQRGREKKKLSYLEKIFTNRKQVIREIQPVFL